MTHSSVRVIGQLAWRFHGNKSCHKNVLKLSKNAETRIGHRSRERAAIHTSYTILVCKCESILSVLDKSGGNTNYMDKAARGMYEA